MNEGEVTAFKGTIAQVRAKFLGGISRHMPVILPCGNGIAMASAICSDDGEGEDGVAVWAMSNMGMETYDGFDKQYLIGFNALRVKALMLGQNHYAHEVLTLLEEWAWTIFHLAKTVPK